MYTSFTAEGFYRFKAKTQHHNDDETARRPHIICSICVHSFGALEKAVRLFMASLHSQLMRSQMCSIYIFVNLQPNGWHFNVGLFDPVPAVWGLGETNVGNSLFDSLWFRINTTFTRMVYLLSFLSYSAGYRSVSVQPPVYPSVRHEYDYNYHCSSYCFVKW